MQILEVCLHIAGITKTCRLAASRGRGAARCFCPPHDSMSLAFVSAQEKATFKKFERVLSRENGLNSALLWSVGEIFIRLLFPSLIRG